MRLVSQPSLLRRPYQTLAIPSSPSACLSYFASNLLSTPLRKTSVSTLCLPLSLLLHWSFSKLLLRFLVYFSSRVFLIEHFALLIFSCNRPIGSDNVYVSHIWPPHAILSHLRASNFRQCGGMLSTRWRGGRKQFCALQFKFERSEHVLQHPKSRQMHR